MRIEATRRCVGELRGDRIVPELLAYIRTSGTSPHFDPPGREHRPADVAQATAAGDAGAPDWGRVRVRYSTGVTGRLLGRGLLPPP